MSKETYIELEDFARVIGMSRDWVAAECRAGRIHHVAIGGPKRKRRKVLAGELERFTEQHQEAITLEHLRAARVRARMPSPVPQRY